jgi:hypothetical protein
MPSVYDSEEWRDSKAQQQKVNWQQRRERPELANGLANAMKPGNFSKKRRGVARRSWKEKVGVVPQREKPNTTMVCLGRAETGWRALLALRRRLNENPKELRPL